MSVRRLAVGRNEASVNKFLGKLNKLIRDRSLEEPKAGLDDAKTRAGEILKRMQQKVVEAKAFISEIEAMKASGKLDEETAKAEALPANTVVRLGDLLESACSKAVSLDDTYTIGRVNISMSVLAGMVSSSLVSRTRYPANDTRLRESMMLGRESQAVSVHVDVCKALDEVAPALGISIPEAPCLSR